jgi:hypothetical protein
VRRWLVLSASDIAITARALSDIDFDQGTAQSKTAIHPTQAFFGANLDDCIGAKSEAIQVGAEFPFSAP